MTSYSMSEKVTNAIDVASTVADRAIDVYAKLRNSFTLSDNTIRQAKECQSKIARLTFKDFDEKYSSKASKEIPVDRFEVFVDKMQKRFDLPNTVKDSILDGLDAAENEENLQYFHFKDGKGNIQHGRFITMKQNSKMDLAYAIYTLSFELAEKETKHGSYDWWFGVLPVWNVTYSKETQNLSKDQKDIFSQWCEVKLHNCVAQEGLKE